MAKTETVHTRVTPDIKKRADNIFAAIGLTTSQAIMLFLTAAVNHNGMPFELSAPKEDLIAFAETVSSVDAGKPSDKAKQIMHLYDDGLIDLETAEFAIKRLSIK